MLNMFSPVLLMNSNHPRISRREIFFPVMLPPPFGYCIYSSKNEQRHNINSKLEREETNKKQNTSERVKKYERRRKRRNGRLKLLHLPSESNKKNQRDHKIYCSEFEAAVFEGAGYLECPGAVLRYLGISVANNKRSRFFFCWVSFVFFYISDGNCHHE